MQTSGSCLYSTAADNSCAWDPRINGLFFYETTAIFPASNSETSSETASEAYLGQPEDSVVVDFNYFRADDALTPRFNQDVWEEVEQLAFFNCEKTIGPSEFVLKWWSDEVVFGKEGVKSDGCALEGQCICSEDRHCSPGKGYFCNLALFIRRLEFAGTHHHHHHHSLWDQVVIRMIYDSMN
ncbi:L-gulonolactone oxidase 3 [Prunus yedoensis var. nudiflora]|uniref:L-gulonolactone oxidase 3 n=1 Tax=Prunus yedoensis var. nudiflora TaxID=2094558 RepID=A0A314Y7B7_PRUYE|nr:L-gulonolactone oxidase 3 [Prunus yedoensis var. nudiflora]